MLQQEKEGGSCRFRLVVSFALFAVARVTVREMGDGRDVCRAHTSWSESLHALYSMVLRRREKRNYNYKEAIVIWKWDKTMNRGEGQYHLSHLFDDLIF